MTHLGQAKPYSIPHECTTANLRSAQLTTCLRLGHFTRLADTARAARWSSQPLLPPGAACAGGFRLCV